MMPAPLPRGTSPTGGGLSETDLSDWLPIADAAAAIGCSTRTVERLSAARKLEQRLRPQAGSPAVAVYNPDDVARIASERHPAPAPFVLPAVQTPSNGNGHGEPVQAVSTRLARASGDDPVRQLAAAFERFLLSPPSPPVAERLAETLFLTIPEAAVVSGFSQAYLRRKCRDGWSGAIKDGAWKIRRRDLEAL